MTESSSVSWKECKLSDVLLSLESGSRPSGGCSTSGGTIPSIGGEHINSNGGFDFSNLKLITEDYFSTMKRGIIRKNDVLVVKDGATTGKVAHVGHDFPYEKAAVNEHVFICRPNPEIILPLFLFYHLYSENGQRLIQRFYHGSAQGGITQDFAERYLIPVPSLKIQHKIVAILDKAEETKRLRAQVNEATQRFLQDVFLQMFGDPVENDMGWEIYTVEDVCRLIRDGEHKTPKYSEEGAPFVTATNLVGETIDFIKTKKLSPEIFKVFSKRAKPEIGDLLMSKDGTIGATQVVESSIDFTIFVSVILFKIKKDLVNPYYLKYLFSSPPIQKEINKRVKGVAIRHIHLNEIRSLRVPIPPMDKQKIFEGIEQQYRRLRQDQKTSEREINNIFNLAANKAFTGELVI